MLFCTLSSLFASASAVVVVGFEFPKLLLLPHNVLPNNEVLVLVVLPEEVLVVPNSFILIFPANANVGVLVDAEEFVKLMLAKG